MVEGSKYRPIDLNELKEIMDDDEELAKECLTDFIKIFPGMLTNIKITIDKRDPAGLDQAAHKLKGTLKYVGAFHAAEKAHELEIMGKQKDLRQVAGPYEALKEECDRVKAFILNYCEEGLEFTI